MLLLIVVLELFIVHVLHKKLSVLISPKTIQINKNAGNRFSLTTGKKNHQIGLNSGRTTILWLTVWMVLIKVAAYLHFTDTGIY